MIYSWSSMSEAICVIAALITTLLACMVAAKDRRSFANRSFIACLATLALVELFRGMSCRAGTFQDEFLAKDECGLLRIAAWIIPNVQPQLCASFLSKASGALEIHADGRVRASYCSAYFLPEFDFWNVPSALAFAGEHHSIGSRRKNLLLLFPDLRHIYPGKL